MTKARITALFAVMAMSAGSLAFAQQYGSSSSPPPSDTSATAPKTQSSDTMNSTSTMSAAQKQAFKDCLTAEKAKNSGATSDQMKETCKSQVKTTTSP
jgi:hypothetical protein